MEEDQKIVEHIFEHKGNRRRVKVEMDDKKPNHDNQILVCCTPLDNNISGALVEEVKFFLGTYTHVG